MAEFRIQSRGEELANTISHGLAFVLAATVAPVLIYTASKAGGAASVVGASVFSFTVVLLYLTSSIYHVLPHNRAKRLFRVLDHSAIFLLIAGTYTPFTLGVLRGTVGWVLFGVIWGLALVGVVSKSIGALDCPKMSVVLYVVMGWLVVFAIKPLWMAMPPWGFYCLVAGGLAYTAGIGFYAAHHVRYAHFVWHLFVMVGTACHAAAIFSVTG